MSDARSSGPNGPAKDVLALFDKAQIGNQRYLTFAQKPSEKAVRTARTDKPFPPSAAVIANAQAPVANSENLRRALSSVLEVNGRRRGDAHRPRLSEGQLVAFASSAGGVGKTTLCATVARLLSSRLSNVLVADRCTDGILPYFFGQERLNAGGLQMVYPNARRAGYQMTLVVAPSEDQSNALTAAWLEQLQSESSLTFLDYPSFQGRPAASLLARAYVIVPLVPDVQSLASIARIESLMPDSAGSQARRSLFVLNRYDDARALHREIRSQLETMLGDRLAPIAVRESEHISEALAQGMTVLDYGPQLPVVQDFEQLTQWLEDRLARVAGVSAGKVEFA